MHPMPPLSRTSSTTSMSSSSDDVGNHGNTNIYRRTRKRFTNAQLTILENLFHQNSHPSREERDTVAKAGGMEIKSVTIWFQNKRQTERKVALHNATNFPLLEPRPSSPQTSTGRSAHSSSSRPSLDRVAARSELRIPTPRTPSRRHNPSANIWDNMPSSPIAPPFSPPSREYVEFGKSQRSKRTLEWACAAARLAEKDSGGISRSSCRSEADVLELTDNETDEAITPNNTWGEEDTRWTVEPGDGMSLLRKGMQDDDMMKAALALCGLGRR